MAGRKTIGTRGIRSSLALAMFAMLSACATIRNAATVYIRSEPTGALVTVDGVGECETPCSIRVDVQRSATVAKAGYLPVRIRLSPGLREYQIKMELAAASEDVDAVMLGDIDE
ncbi:MAG: PEGA domain-containing protein [Marinicaulis sp.]|nr:PEGA domain-containing protein [Marinicaulis sp.]